MSQASFGEGRQRRSGLPAIIERPARRLLTRLAVHENVAVGDAFRVGRGAVISSPHGLRLGNGISVGPHTIIQVDGEIGDFALIGIGVQIVGREDHLIDEIGVPMIRATAVSERPGTPRDQVWIGRDVWIGGASTVLSGVTIGDGAVVGAASVVTRDVPPFAIAVGNPARVVGTRFANDDEREQHLRGLDELSRRLFGGPGAPSAASEARSTLA